MDQNNLTSGSNEVNAMQMLGSGLNHNLSFSFSTANITGAGQIDSMGNLQNLQTSAQVNVPYTIGCWDYWQNWYYPQVIHHSYPIYIQERAMDKGKQAFEIIKILKDKKLVKLEKVGDFIDLMDELIKIL